MQRLACGLHKNFQYPTDAEECLVDVSCQLCIYSGRLGILLLWIYFMEGSRIYPFRPDRLCNLFRR